MGPATKPVGVSPGPVELLRDAVSQVAVELEQLGGVSNEDTRAHLDPLTDCIQAVLGGKDPQQAASAIDHPTLAVHLIGVIRPKVVARRTAANAGAILDVVTALEVTAEALQDYDPEDLRARLAQPDALGLLVEVAHDLRSPLTSILFLSETLRVGHSGEVNDIQKSQLGLIYSAALGLVSIASDIVDLARDGKGLVEGDPEPYSVAEVLRGVEEMVRPIAEEKQIDLRIVVREMERAHGHPIPIGRVLLNLTTNALKFTDEGMVELGARRLSTQAIEYYVRDTGRGISEERRKELFQPFKARPERRGHFFSGSGVGLSIARRLLRAMGSDLELESGEGGGSRFYFTLSASSPRRH